MRILILLVLFSKLAFADVVKPALIEIVANTDGAVNIEIRASIEALLTGINTKYKNTQDSPYAAEYDLLRNMPSEQLLVEFNKFKDYMLDEVKLTVDGKKIKLFLDKAEIPEVGYPKVPRISLIKLKAKIARDSKQLVWFYPLKFGDNAVRVKQVNREQEQYHWSDWQWLRNNKSSLPFSLSELFKPIPLGQQLMTYLSLGVMHIVPKGLDHILFILGIFLFTHKMRPLISQVTMFTIAHTITLGLAINGTISLPAQIVEPLIALSIAYVGLENIWVKSLHWWRLLLVFAFGLLHGLGFASVLADFGMPEANFVSALLSFNLGVEIAQIAIILVAYLTVKYWRHTHYWQKTRIALSMMIAVVGIYWTLERALII